MLTKESHDAPPADEETLLQTLSEIHQQFKEDSNIRYLVCATILSSILLVTSLCILATKNIWSFFAGVVIIVAALFSTPIFMLAVTGVLVMLVYEQFCPSDENEQEEEEVAGGDFDYVKLEEDKEDNDASDADVQMNKPGQQPRVFIGVPVQVVFEFICQATFKNGAQGSKTYRLYPFVLKRNSIGVVKSFFLSGEILDCAFSGRGSWGWGSSTSSATATTTAESAATSTSTTSGSATEGRSVAGHVDGQVSAIQRVTSLRGSLRFLNGVELDVSEALHFPGFSISWQSNILDVVTKHFPNTVLGCAPW